MKNEVSSGHQNGTNEPSQINHHHVLKDCINHPQNARFMAVACQHFLLIVTVTAQPCRSLRSPPQPCEEGSVEDIADLMPGHQTGPWAESSCHWDSDPQNG